MAVLKKHGVAVIGEFFIDEIFSEFEAMPKFGRGVLRTALST
jgi:hypothetical protein